MVARMTLAMPGVPRNTVLVAEGVWQDDEYVITVTVTAGDRTTGPNAAAGLVPPDAPRAPRRSR